jgi:hypothetical protein
MPPDARVAETGESETMTFDMAVGDPRCPGLLPGGEARPDDVVLKRASTNICSQKTLNLTCLQKCFYQYFGQQFFIIFALFAWLISHQPAVLLSQNKPATSNKPAVLFSQNKPAISH